ncbi:hypothetical protein V1522DRAFT_416863 [Lipomyces starkeyi]
MTGFLNVYTISIFAALAGALFGFDIASISGVVGRDQYWQYWRHYDSVFYSVGLFVSQILRLPFAYRGRYKLFRQLFCYRPILVSLFATLAR